MIGSEHATILGHDWQVRLGSTNDSCHPSPSAGRMTDEEKLCTALSLLLYGDSVLMSKSVEETSAEDGDEEKKLDQWLIDDGALNHGLFLRSDAEGGDLLDLTSSMEVEQQQMKGHEDRETLFLAPMPPQAPPPPSSQRKEEKRPDSPMPSAVFLRSDCPSDEWIIA